MANKFLHFKPHRINLRLNRDFASVHGRAAARVNSTLRNKRKTPSSSSGVTTSEQGGNSYSFCRGGVITNVTTHGLHHHAQCLNMLRQLGVDPLPHSSVVEWIMVTGN
jgi:uncharacterized damage-inducible protein DinB